MLTWAMRFSCALRLALSDVVRGVMRRLACTGGAGALLLAIGGQGRAQAAPARSERWTLAPRAGVVIEGFGDTASFVRVAGAARLRDRSLVVADERLNRVFFFASDGKPRASFGRGGDGPGEFRGIVWMGRCEPDTLSVYDPVQARITRIAPNGTLVGVRSASPQGPLGYWTPGGRSPYLLTCGPRGGQALVSWPRGQLPKAPGPHRGRVDIAVARGASTPYALVGHFAGPERYRFKTSDGPRAFGKSVHIAVSDSQLFVGTADSFFVQVFDLQGRPKGTMRGGAPPRRFTDADKEAYAGRAAWTLASAAQQRRIRDAVNEMTFPEFLPVYDRFLLDERQRLWVQEGVAPTQRSRRWWGFDATGAVFAVLDTPAAFAVLQLSESEALGTWTDEDGVESVRSFAVQRRR